MRTFVVIISLIFSTGLNAQKGKLYLSSWHRNGDSESNVPSDKYLCFDKAKIYYFLSNDNANVYLDMKIVDPGVQNRILKEGLTVWIDMDSKPSKKLGVKYPIGAQ